MRTHFLSNNILQCDFRRSSELRAGEPRGDRVKYFIVLVCLIFLTGCVSTSDLNEAIQKSELAQEVKFRKSVTAQDQNIAQLTERYDRIDSSIVRLHVSLESLNSTQRKRKEVIRKMISSLEDQANALKEELSGIQ